MSFLYLLRHGAAVSGFDDASRELSAKGRGEIAAVAAYLKRNAFRPAAVWHSEKTRSRQSARVMASIWEPDALPLEEKKGLNPEDPPAPLFDEVEAFMLENRKPLMLVSHLPFLPHLMSHILGSREDLSSVIFSTGGCACLEYSADRGWSMACFVSPRDLGG